MPTELHDQLADLGGKWVKLRMPGQKGNVWPEPKIKIPDWLDW